MKKSKISLLQFEVLQESENGTLQSGFSVAIINHHGGLVGATNKECTITNNCNGGNCVKGCQSYPPGSGG